MAGDLAAALDPVVLAERLELSPDSWQEEFLGSTSDRILLNCCRQAGKSTMTALLGVHTAVYQPESLVLMLSPSLTIVSETSFEDPSTRKGVDPRFMTRSLVRV